MAERYARVSDILLYRVTPEDAKRFDAMMREAGYFADFYEPGHEVPLMVTRTTGRNVVNGHLMMDGPFTLWVQGKEMGTKPGNWRFGDHFPVECPLRPGGAP
jgi:hypothetical protein